MLKRCQVLLSDWQVDFIKKSAEKYDFSFSEVIRILVSEASLNILHSLYPGKKIGIDSKELTKLKKAVNDPSVNSEEVHKMISKLYFEARKAVDYMQEEDQKRGKARIGSLRK